MDAARACHGFLRCHSLSAWDNNDSIVAAVILGLVIIIIAAVASR